jgi:hypothetical protein
MISRTAPHDGAACWVDDQRDQLGICRQRADLLGTGTDASTAWCQAMTRQHSRRSGEVIEQHQWDRRGMVAGSHAGVAHSDPPAHPRNADHARVAGADDCEHSTAPDPAGPGGRLRSEPLATRTATDASNGETRPHEDGRRPPPRAWSHSVLQNTHQFLDQ